MSFFGVAKDADDNAPSYNDAQSIVELQPKVEEKSAVKIEEKVDDSKYPLLLKSATGILPSYHLVDRGDKGVLEDFFFDYLIRSFPNSANNSIAIKAGNYDFTPDLAIIDEEKSLFIAIEIDEPYSIGSNGILIPIHTIGSDTNRDKHFTAGGWTVVRFAEEQVAKCPQFCVDTIRYFIDNGQLLDMNCIKRWTFDEAQTMIDKAYRNTYLPFAFKSANVELAKSNASYRSFELSSIIKREKNCRSFIVINLKYPRIMNNSGEIVATGNCPEQCWIEQEVFWSKVYSSKFGNMIDEYDLRDIAGRLINARSGSIMLEGYGKQNGTFFNIIYDRFDIKFSLRFLENVKSQHLKIVNKERAKYGLPKLT